MSHKSLNPTHTATLVRSTPEFWAALPIKNAEDMPPDELKRFRTDAIIKGAAGAALRLEQEHGAYDLDANLMSLIAHLNVFYNAQSSLTEFRDHYGHAKRHDIPDNIYEGYLTDKRRTTKFNHILREVINAGAGKFNFNELLVFLTNQHIAMGGKDSQNEFHGMTRTALVGMRNEIAVEQILIRSGIEYKLGTEEQDAHGGDFIIDGVGIDVKASEKTTEHAKQNASHHGYNPDVIVWSHINFKDFDGELFLPQHLNEQVASDLIPDINVAIDSEKYRSVRQA